MCCSFLVVLLVIACHCQLLVVRLGADAVFMCYSYFGISIGVVLLLSYCCLGVVLVLSCCFLVVYWCEWCFLVVHVCALFSVCCLLVCDCFIVAHVSFVVCQSHHTVVSLLLL